MNAMDAPKACRLIVVDDEGPLLEALCRTLREVGYEATGFLSARAALAALANSKFDLLLCDLRMPEMEGIALLRAARELDPDLVGIIMTGQGTIDTAIEAMKAGALDYVLKPFKLSIVLPVLERGLAMRRLRMENTALQQRVNERTAELEGMNRELEAFAYSISHDLRAPVRAVSGFANFLKQDFGGLLPPEGLQLLEVIRGSALQMGRMIDALLELSRLGRHPIEQEPVEMAALAAEVVADLKRLPGADHATIEVGGLRPCFGDPALLRQVWTNLVSNALKFSARRQEARVEIGCQDEAGRAVYFVRDNGAGFDSRYTERLFAPFRRLHGEEFEGHGVGLSIVKRIVERHGGQVRAESEVDRGATFYFTINLPEPAAGGEPEL
jgi:two-component system sensor histidine kinase/response regulator